MDVNIGGLLGLLIFVIIVVAIAACILWAIQAPAIAMERQYGRSSLVSRPGSPVGGTPMPAPKKPRKVLRAFKDAAGKQWQQGQDYTGEDADAQAQQGNVEAAPPEE